VDQPEIALVGVNGWGGVHLDTIARLRAAGTARLVAVCEPAPLPADTRAAIGDVPVYPTLDDLLAAHRPSVTVLVTPIHTHAGLAAAALRAGSDVLLEKPPVTGLDEHAALLALAEETGRAVQVGFQNLGSPAVAALAELAADGTLGAVRGVGAAGRWVRDRRYYRRSRWAGRRRLDGVAVVDGSLTNPFAHSVQTALAAAGAAHGPLRTVEVELFRANDIEADDTGCVRVTPAAGPPVVVATTLCASREHEPWVAVFGEAGTARLDYRFDRVTVTTPDGTREHEYDRTDLLANLIAHRADPAAVPLLSPLAATAAFTQVLQAIRDAPDPTPIPPEHWTEVGAGDDAHRVLAGIDDAAARAATDLMLYSELGLPWT
jgi:predicted dehydrogenase